MSHTGKVIASFQDSTHENLLRLVAQAQRRRDSSRPLKTILSVARLNSEQALLD